MDAYEQRVGAIWDEDVIPYKEDESILLSGEPDNKITNNKEANMPTTKPQLTQAEVSAAKAAGTKLPAWTNLAPGECTGCDNPDFPVCHIGSNYCRSMGLGAAGGFRTHCTCDSCF